MSRVNRESPEAHDTWSLILYRGVEAITNDGLINNVVLMGSVLNNGTTTTFVCLAEVPEAVVRTKPELYMNGYTIFNVKIYPTIKGGSPVSKLPSIDKTITDLIAQSSPPSVISNANQTLSVNPLKKAIECRDVTCAFKDFDFSFINNNPKYEFSQNIFLNRKNGFVFNFLNNINSSSNNKNALSIPIAATIKLLNQWKACRIDNAIRIGNAYSAYNNMIQENIKPDVYTYLSLIIGCASKLDLDLALTTTDNLVNSIYIIP
ncbi:5314_t:CDS:2 [Entrophospora sp. SA101]|nr:5314_t:CDS:2 [Entrophospora sp. SA101]